MSATQRPLALRHSPRDVQQVPRLRRIMCMLRRARDDRDMGDGGSLTGAGAAAHNPQLSPARTGGAHTHPMTHDAPATEDTSPAALWEAARYALRWLVQMFGSPVEIAELGVLAPREHSDMLSWLRPLEGLVRALLLIMAAEAARVENRGPSRRAPQRPARHVVEQNPERSEDWRVSFRAMRGNARPSRPRRQTTRAIPSAWPIAERLEAVIRVLENPKAYARRLAVRLNTRRDRVDRMLARPPEPAPRRPGAWALQAAHSQAIAAVAAFDTS